MPKNKLFFAIILSSQISIFCQTNNNLPEPYNSIKILPLDLHGWFAESNKDTLTKLIKTHSPKIIVEIGVWTGKSAIYMATITPDNCILYAIDHFKGQTYYNETNLTPKMASLLPILYEQFLSNVIHSNLTHKIIPVKLSSLEAANVLNIQPDLVYIDGSHLEEDVFNDICAWHEKLAPSGIICGDDYEAPGVKKAVHRAAQKFNYHVNQVANSFWYFN